MLREHPPDSTFGNTIRTRQQSLENERAEVAKLGQSRVRMVSILDAVTSDDDPALATCATLLDQAEQRARQIDRWLDLQDDWL